MPCIRPSDDLVGTPDAGLSSFGKNATVIATCAMVVGALVSLLVSLAWPQAKDLDAALTIWPTRGGSGG
jgi:hypothetical protein